MQIDGIKGHKMTDIESQIFQMYEEDKVSQKVIDALNEIGCKSFISSKEEIKTLLERERENE